MERSSIQAGDSIQAALYARVSSDRQAQTGTIGSQIAAVLEHAAGDGLSIDPELRFIDDGYSGATLVRPALERLRDTAAAGGFQRLYILCPDRLARSYAYQMLLVDELQRCGVELRFVNRPLGHSPEDQLLLQVQGVVAEYERAKILERGRRGRLHAAQRGSVSVMSKAPYGYRYISRIRGVSDAQYNLNLQEAGIVLGMFQWVALERMSISQVCRRLNAGGVPSPGGSGRWPRSTVWQMLQNPAYMGQAAYGKSRWGPLRPRLRAARNHPEQSRRGKSSYDVPAEQWTSIPVPPIVPVELFQMVQQQLEENRRRCRQRLRGARHLLQGLLVCRCCGYAYIGLTPHRKRRLGYYQCSGSDAARFGGHRICQNKSVREDLLDQAVWGDVCAMLKQPQRLQEELNRRLDPHADDPDHSARRKLNIQIDQTRRGIARLIDAYGEGLVQKSEFEPRIASARQRLSQLQLQLQSHVDQQARARELRLVIDNLQTFAQRVTEGLDQADWLTRRDIIRMLIKRVEVDQEEVNIVYRVDLKPLDPRPQTSALQHCSWRRCVVARVKSAPAGRSTRLPSALRLRLEESSPKSAPRRWRPVLGRPRFHHDYVERLPTL